MLIFGYGSLMWRPEVAYRAKYPALLRGYRRAYVQVSTRVRGSEEAPGMVMGIVPGGQCWGVVFEFDSHAASSVLAEVDEREGQGRANWRVMLPVSIERNKSTELRPVTFDHAWTYFPWPKWKNYCGIQAHDLTVERVAMGVGDRGSAHDYLRCVNKELDTMNHPDPELTQLQIQVEQYRSTHTS